jgi:hypothetical protein
MTGIKRINSGRGHYYKIDGTKADGVTTLIGDGMRKKALEYWSANATAEYAVDNWAELEHLAPSQRLWKLKKARFESRDAAANRGTQVHALAEKLVTGEEVEVPEELAGYVESYIKFLDEWQPKPVLVEATVASRKWNYCGTLDLVGDLPDGSRPILDLKTSGSGVYPEVALQLSAYRHADVYLDGDEEKPMADVGITGSLVVWVRADGYDVYPVDTSERTFKDFLHVAYVARRTKKDVFEQLLKPALPVPTWGLAA